MLEFAASYRESPRVSTRRRGLEEFEPGELPPVDDPDVDDDYVGRPDRQFVGKNFNASVAAIGSRSRIRLRYFNRERDFIEASLEDESEQGIGLGASRRFSSSLSGQMDINYTQFERSAEDVDPGLNGGKDKYGTGVSMRLNRATGTRLTTSGELGYVQGAGARVYDGWWTAVRLRYSL
jgi:hypothetical protein